MSHPPQNPPQNPPKSPSLGASCELVSAMLAGQIKPTDISDFTTNPKAFVFEKLNMDIGDDIEVTIVENSRECLHLTLPYYAALEKISGEALDDASIEEISAGGEIAICLFVGAVTATVLIGGATSVGTAVGIVAGERAKHGEDLLGSPK